jgi:hypothetical protein
MLAWVVGALLLQQPDSDKAIALFFDAITRLDERDARAKLNDIAGDTAGSVEAIADTYRRGVRMAKDLEKEEEKAARHLEDVKVVMTKDGQKGNVLDEVRAREALEKIRARQLLLDDFIPRVCATLASARSQEARDAVLARTKSAPDWYFRAHAVAASATFDGTEQALYEQLLKESEPGVKVALLDALRPRAAKDRGFQDLCVELAKAPAWQVRVAALQVLRVAAPKSCVPTLVAAMEGAGGRMVYEINETLKSITSVNKNDYDGWKAWWEKNGEAFLAGTYVPHISDRADNKGRSTFYGLPIHSTNLVFAIDFSSSMLTGSEWKPSPGGEPLAGDARIDVAKHELKRVLKELPGGTKFNVCAYHRLGTLYADRMTGLDDDERRKAGKWLDALKTDSGTETYEAIRVLFDRHVGSWNAKLRSDAFDTVILLTDGEPTGRVQMRPFFLEKMADLGRFKKIAIHVIGIGAVGDPELLLKGVAEQSGGTYVRR